MNYFQIIKPKKLIIHQIMKIKNVMIFGKNVEMKEKKIKTIFTIKDYVKVLNVYLDIGLKMMTSQLVLQIMKT